MTKLLHHYGGWRPTPEHLRPQLAEDSGLTVLPEVDPRKQLPPIFDQGQLGSCTANATAAAFQYDAILDGHDPGLLSRLWIYYQERKIEGALGQGDTGAIGSDAFKVASEIGVPKETDWPYKIGTFEGPVPKKAVRDEQHYRLTKPYHSVTQSERAIKAILSNKQTVSFGFNVYDSFESAEVAKSGIVPMPDTNREQLLGGHEVLAVGYLKSHPDHVLVRNSWSTSWGMSGYCLMPWKYIVNASLTGDLTTIVRSTN